MVKFIITSGPQKLCETEELNIAMACFEGIINKFGSGDNFIISLNKETTPDLVKTEEPKEEQTVEMKKATKKK